MTKKIIIAALACLAGAASWAQQIVTENGKAYRLYTVQAGEGLYRISVNNNTTQEELLAANPELKNTGIKVGTVLRIPLKYRDVQQQQQAGKYETHVVQLGETAYSISTKYGMKLVDFYALNPDCETGIVEGHVVKVRIGEVMPLGAENYRLHTIAAGETLYGIGKKYGVKAEQILAANPSLDAAHLPVGTLLRIPDTDIPAEDEHYVYHRIAQGETLYALCIKYNLLQEKIMEVNPSIDWNALHIGQVIAIPKAATRTVSYRTHEVDKKETLYGISKMYGVSVDEIKQANPTVDTSNLQKGVVLRIPYYSEQQSDAPATANPTYVGLEQNSPIGASYGQANETKHKISVAVMLPFDAEQEMRKMNEAGKNTESSVYTFGTRRYIEFYEGVRMAADSFARRGTAVELHLYDTSTKLNVVNATQSIDFDKHDLIFGPAHREKMKVVADYAFEHRIPVVLPFAQMDSSICSNPYLFQASVIDTITGRAVLDAMLDSCVGKHVVLLSPSTKKSIDAWRVEYIKEACAQRGISISLHSYSVTAEMEDFLQHLSTEMPNVLILPTNAEAGVNSTIVSIASIIDNKPEAKVQLFGMGEWLTFQTIEVEVFHKLNTHIFSTFGLDYNDPQTRYILNQYREKFNSEPVAFTPYFQQLRPGSGFSEFALWGYDLALKFIGARLTLGPDFIRYINSYDPPAAQSNFHFHNVTNWGGSVNIGLKTIQFRPDYSIIVSDFN